MFRPLDPIQGLQQMHIAASSLSVPVRCSDCRRPFDLRNPRRRIATLEDQLALCSGCTWYLEHPGEARR